MSEESQHQLQWRGKSYGPWTYAEIQERLREGEIHSLHQVQVDGAWMLLRDYIENQEAEARLQRAAEMAAQIRAQESAKKQSAKPLVRGRIEGPVTRPNPFANPPPVYVKSVAASEGGTNHYYTHDDVAPTCWLAVAAFVVSCCSFVPYLNLISWLPSLVLGHLALQQIQRQPALEGKGLALGALAIAYTMLAFATFSFLMFPDLFYRIFPIAG